MKKLLYILPLLLFSFLGHSQISKGVKPGYRFPSHSNITFVSDTTGNITIYNDGLYNGDFRWNATSTETASFDVLQVSGVSTGRYLRVVQPTSSIAGLVDSLRQRLSYPSTTISGEPVGIDVSGNTVSIPQTKQTVLDNDNSYHGNGWVSIENADGIGGQDSSDPNINWYVGNNLFRLNQSRLYTVGGNWYYVDKDSLPKRFGIGVSGGSTGTEVDPVFGGSPASNITTTNLNNWNTAYNKYIISGSFSAGTLTLARQDGTTLPVTGFTVSNGGNYTLPYNGGAQYYLAGDSTLHPISDIVLSSSQILSALGYTPLQNVTGYITAGSNITITGNGTIGSPYVINSTASGSGSLTSFSFTNVNGITGTVTNATTTPNLTLALGAIAPSSVTASGTVTGSNLSGTNTGDQNLSGYETTTHAASTYQPIGNYEVTTNKVNTLDSSASNYPTTAAVKKAISAIPAGSGFTAGGDLTGSSTSQTVNTINGFPASRYDPASSIQTQLNGKEPTISTGTTGQYWRGDKTFQTLDKTAVGLSNVDNTSDVNKPVSTPQQTALNLKKNTNDSAGVSGFYPNYRADSSRTALYAAIATKQPLFTGNTDQSPLGDASLISTVNFALIGKAYPAGGAASLQTVTVSSSTNFTLSSGTFTSSGTTGSSSPSQSARAVVTGVLPANTTGFISATYTGTVSDRGIISIDLNNTANTYDNWKYAFYPYNGTYYVSEGVATGTSTGVTAVTNDKYRIFRDSATGIVTAMRSQNSGSTWTTIYTFASATTLQVYYKVGSTKASATISNVQATIANGQPFNPGDFFRFNSSINSNSAVPLSSFTNLIPVTDYGAIGDSATVTDAAFSNALTASGTGTPKVIYFPQTSTKTGNYYFTSTPNLAGVTIAADAGVKLSFPTSNSITFSGATFNTAIGIYSRDRNNIAQIPITNVPDWISKALDGSTERVGIRKPIAFDATTYTKRQYNTASSGFITGVATLTNSTTVQWAQSSITSATGIDVVGGVPLAGRQYDAALSAPSMTGTTGSRAAILFDYGTGYFLFSTDNSTSGQFYTGTYNGTSYTETSGGYTGIPSMTVNSTGASAIYSYRIVDATNIEVYLNGSLYVKQTLPAAVQWAGTGYYGTATAGGITYLYDPIYGTSLSKYIGKNLIINWYGDSNSFGEGAALNAPNMVKFILEGKRGVGKVTVNNYAVSGNRASQQQAILNAQTITAGAVYVIYVGTNDVQALTAVSSYKSSLVSMITKVKTGGGIPILVNFPLFTSATITGAGFATSNYQYGGVYREAVGRVAAEQSVVYADAMSAIGKVDSTLYQLRDNIHEQTAYKASIAQEIAKAITQAVGPADIISNSVENALSGTAYIADSTQDGGSIIGGASFDYTNINTTTNPGFFGSSGQRNIYVNCAAASSDMTIYLPTLANWKGRKFNIIKTDSLPYRVTIIAGSLNSGNIITLVSQWSRAIITNDGTRATGSVVLGNNTIEISGTSVTSTSPGLIYIPHSTSLTTIPLPAATTIGSLFQIVGDGSGKWAVSQAAGQQIVGVGGMATTTGTGGSITATDRYCTLTLRLIGTNKWSVTSSQGTLTYQ